MLDDNPGRAVEEGMMQDELDEDGDDKFKKKLKHKPKTRRKRKRWEPRPDIAMGHYNDQVERVRDTEEDGDAE